MEQLSRSLSVVVATTIILLVSTPLEARFIRFDSGDNWGNPMFADVNDANPSTKALVNIGFDVNFGAGDFSQLMIHEDGFVTFDDGSSITPFLSDFVSNPAAMEVESPGAISYNQGLIDGGVFTGTPDALRVQWFDPANGLAYQLVLLDQLGGSGNFSLELNYGCDRPGSGCQLTSVGDASSTAGYQLDGNVFNMNGPFSAATDYTFNFRDGVLTTVPLPAAVWLFLSGLAFLFGLNRREFWKFWEFWGQSKVPE